MIVRLALLLGNESKIPQAVIGGSRADDVTWPLADVRN
jgi:hypothetical protein